MAIRKTYLERYSSTFSGFPKGAWMFTTHSFPYKGVRKRLNCTGPFIAARLTVKHQFPFVISLFQQIKKLPPKLLRQHFVVNKKIILFICMYPMPIVETQPSGWHNAMKVWVLHHVLAPGV